MHNINFNKNIWTDCTEIFTFIVTHLAPKNTDLLLFQFDSYRTNSLESYPKSKGIPMASCREAVLEEVANSTGYPTNSHLNIQGLIPSKKDPSISFEYLGICAVVGSHVWFIISWHFLFNHSFFTFWTFQRHCQHSHSYFWGWHVPWAPANRKCRQGRR